MDQKPSTALTKRFLTPRTALIGAGIVALVAGGGVGAYALAQQQPANERPIVQVEPSSTPEETPEPNIAPIANFTATAISGTSITLDASTASDADGTIADYSWDFGNGATGTGPVVSYDYGNYGTYTITLTVTDSDGETASVSAAVDIAVPVVVNPPANNGGGYTYGNYPPGAVMPNLPGTDSPDTSACASSTGTVNAQGQLVCA